MVAVPIHDAHGMVVSALQGLRYPEADAGTIADHLMDCELRGLGYGGLARVLTISERLDAPPNRDLIRTVFESQVSVSIDGGDQIGYLVALEATNHSIAKTAASGLSVVAASNTWCSGMSSYYLEKVTAAGLVGLVFATGGPVVAPFGGTEARVGTNPVACGIPVQPFPVIWDIGTSAVMIAEATLAKRLGRDLPAGSAFSVSGEPTVDPGAALSGAFAPWGGHKGSGLAIVTQLLGFLTGASLAPTFLRDHAFLIVTLDPACLGNADHFHSAAAEFTEIVRATRPLNPNKPVRLPFDGSRKRREEALRSGVIEVEQSVFDALLCLPGRR